MKPVVNARIDLGASGNGRIETHPVYERANGSCYVILGGHRKNVLRISKARHAHINYVMQSAEATPVPREKHVPTRSGVYEFEPIPCPNRAGRIALEIYPPGTWMKGTSIVNKDYKVFVGGQAWVLRQHSKVRS